MGEYIDDEVIAGVLSNVKKFVKCVVYVNDDLNIVVEKKEGQQIHKSRIVGVYDTSSPYFSTKALVDDLMEMEKEF